ncbi:MAG: GntR family transcriptional regulator [Lachnospiraceae bacterium]|nr:GntR family transcriptional regulator [Lachnospiraceae bacterium]
MDERYEKRIERNLDELEGFTQTMRGINMEPSFRILSKNLRIAGNRYAKLFGIKPEEKIVAIKRVCLADGEPVSLEQTYIPYDLVPKIEGIDLNIFSIYEVYRMFGVRLANAKQTLDLVRPSAADARVLGIDPDTPTMLFQCVTYDVEGRVVEFNKNYTRGDKCSFRVHFTR